MFLWHESGTMIELQVFDMAPFSRNIVRNNKINVKGHTVITIFIKSDNLLLLTNFKPKMLTFQLFSLTSTCYCNALRSKAPSQWC